MFSISETGSLIRMISVFLILILISHSYADQCASIPPSLWCANTELSRHCGFNQLCTRYKETTRNQPINITVLIEALCPDCQKWIVYQLYPKIFKSFRSFVNIELVPYGNAKLVNNSVKCQHGEEECRINRFESCVIDSTETQDQYVPLIFCIENQLKIGASFNKASTKCFRTLSVRQETQQMIQSCFVSHRGEDLQQSAAVRTASIWPDKHTHVPWVLFNNVSISSAQVLINDIPSLICQWYSGDNLIPYCEAIKKSTRPSHLN